ncbi:MAG: acylhydrolase [Arcobacter sp.]|mgnify:CR=1 FL=1|nr:acylhydrolase [Arcobacter sp.]|tara:strand:- start:8513 stop:9169 length:657 start_codon:yes stop_codon:yes gene_type:complete
MRILALGDCNTLGIGSLKNNSYPERFASKYSFTVINSGYTMTTTNEARHFFDKYYDDSIDIILIQYGVVDSWKTFKYSPYVLYYPDNILRKIARKIVKKYKKICKNLGLNNSLGTKNVVSPDSYKNNLEYIFSKIKNKKVFLLDTVPNRELERNSNIKQYNKILDELSSNFNNCHRVKFYDLFEKNLDTYYLDNTHINDLGYKIITEELIKTYENSSN